LSQQNYPTAQSGAPKSTVYIVEDDVDACDMLAALLKSSGLACIALTTRKIFYGKAPTRDPRVQWSICICPG